MNNGIIFGTQGPVMSGTWYNPATGDSFTVMDSFFENNQYVVKTTDNRILSYDVIQNYVQSDKPIAMPKKQQDELPAEVANLIADDIDMFVDDDIYGVQPITLGNLNAPKSTPAIVTNEGIIAKALGKASKPEVVADIKWNNFPKKEIQMLNEIMEIDTKEIVEWYASQLDTTEIAIAIHNSIVSYINDQLYGRVPNTIEIDLTLESEKAIKYEPLNSVTEESVMFVDETPVKTPKKSTPKKTTKKAKK